MIYIYPIKCYIDSNRFDFFRKYSNCDEFWPENDAEANLVEQLCDYGMLVSLNDSYKFTGLGKQILTQILQNKP